MKSKGFFLSWIVVEDISEAIDFYTNTLGCTLHEFHKEMGWAELSGPEGFRIGIAQVCPTSEIKAGANAVMTVTVDDLDASVQELKTKGVRLIGEVLEVPGHVKMQTFLDRDGNTLQLVQMLTP